MSNFAPVRHLMARKGEPLPPPAGLYDYLLAGNGVFIRAVKKGIRACVQIAECDVRGLDIIAPLITFTWPRVPAALTAEMLWRAQDETDARGRPVEVLFHLVYSEARGWQLVKPPQKQSVGAVMPLPPFNATYKSYTVEVHSHHTLDVHQFSATDDLSEGTLFRFFGLLYDLKGRPGLALRLNVYGYRCDVPAALVFELPDEIEDGSANWRVGQPDDEAGIALPEVTDD